MSHGRGSSPEPGSPSAELVRALGLADCILLVLGAIIGSGIFLTPGGIARTTQSTGAVFFVWILGGVLTFCGALSYAELGAAYPRAGGIYVFLREAYGRATAFLFGWCVFFVMVSGSIATLAAAFAIYLSYLVPMPLLASKLCAVAVILVLSLVNCLGVRSGALVQNLLGIIKIGSLAGIAVALFLSGKGDLRNITASPGTFSSTPWSALGIAMVAVLWAYEGWYLLTFAAGEVKNPRRNLTAGLLLGTFSVMVLYLVVNLAYMYVLPFGILAGSSRVASDSLELSIGTVGGTIVALAILVSITGAMNSNVLGGPRVFYAMARQKLFFRGVAYIHPRYHVPTVSIVLNGIWASFLTMIGSFERLFSYVIFVAWIFYALGAAAVIVLRHKQPDIARPYKTWGYPVVPVLFCLIAAAIVLNTIVNDFRNSFWGLLVVAAGLPAYFYWHRGTDDGKL